MGAMQLGCRRVRGAFSPYLDRRLDERARARVDAHLDGCDDCRGALRVLELTALALASAGPARVPSDLAGRTTRAVWAAESSGSRYLVTFIERFIPIAWPAALVTSVATLALLYFALPARDDAAPRHAGQRAKARAEPTLELTADPIAQLTPIDIEYTSAASDEGDGDPLLILLPLEDR